MRRLQLEGGSFVLVGCLIRLSEQGARACCLVRSLERMPAPDSLSQRRDCRGRVRFRESDQPSRPAGCRSQCIRAIEGRERVELYGGVTCRLHLFRGDGDLDEGGEEPRSLHAIVWDVGERPRELR